MTSQMWPPEPSETIGGKTGPKLLRFPAINQLSISCPPAGIPGSWPQKAVRFQVPTESERESTNMTFIYIYIRIYVYVYTLV